MADQAKPEIVDNVKLSPLDDPETWTNPDHPDYMKQRNINKRSGIKTDRYGITW